MYYKTLIFEVLGLVAFLGFSAIGTQFSGIGLSLIILSGTALGFYYWFSHRAVTNEYEYYIVCERRDVFHNLHPESFIPKSHEYHYARFNKKSRKANYWFSSRYGTIFHDDEDAIFSIKTVITRDNLLFNERNRSVYEVASGPFSNLNDAKNCVADSRKWKFSTSEDKAKNVSKSL